MNCFTISVYDKMNQIRKRNYEEKTGTKYINNKGIFSPTDFTIVPNVSAQWNQRDQIQINFSDETRKNFCIQTKPKEIYYENPEIKECLEIETNDEQAFYKLKSNSLTQKLKKNFYSIEQIALNTNYPNDLVFILKNQSYLIVHNSKEVDINTSIEVLKEKNEWISNFLDNQENTVSQKKINTMLEIKINTSNEQYIAFLYKENPTHKILIIEWEYKEILKKSAVGKFILWTILLPFALAGDILLSPITIPLGLIFLILWNSRDRE